MDQHGLSYISWQQEFEQLYLSLNEGMPAWLIMQNDSRILGRNRGRKMLKRLLHFHDVIEKEVDMLKSQLLQKRSTMKCVQSFVERKAVAWRNEVPTETESERLNQGWMRGRLYNMRKGNLLMTPTNMGPISYLDLAEFSVSCDNASQYCENINELFLVSLLSHEYHLECHDAQWAEAYSEIFEDLTNEYLQYVDESMHSEYMFNVAFTLSKKWDDGTFLRYTDSYRKFIAKYDIDFNIRTFPRILLEYCDDSVIIVNYFRVLCSRDISAIMKKMRSEYLYFFMLHIHNRLIYHPQPRKFENWILNDLQLVERAFSKGIFHTLKLLLSYGWPMNCCTPDDENFMFNLNWPRESKDYFLESRSSAAFTTHFVFYLLQQAMFSEVPKNDLADCIRLFWRTVPAPYVSLGDLERLYYSMHSSDSSGEDMSENERSAFINELLSIYPNDCLTDYQPRSLEHLCRCKIRETLDTTTYVDVLPIPRSIKKYMLLDS